MKTIKQIKKDDFFVLKPHNGSEAKESEVYIRGEYDRTEKSINAKSGTIFVPLVTLKATKQFIRILYFN